MGFAEEMANFGEHLVSSFDNRIKDVKGVMAASHRMRNEIRHGNNNLFKQTHNFLNDSRSNHKDMARKQHYNLAKFTKDLSNNTFGMLGDFDKGHKDMARKQRQFLGNFFKELQSQESKSHRERRKFMADTANYVKNVQDECHKFLGKCDKEQQMLHNEFKRAHQNFQRAMKEMAGHRAAVKFPTYSESKSGSRAMVTEPRRASPKKKAMTKKRGPTKRRLIKKRGRRRVSR